MLKKKFLKTECQVTFELSIPEKAGRVNLVGEFNDWNTLATPMDWKQGKYVITLDLNLNREYQFRYLIDGHEWRNDEQADAYVANRFGSDNSVVLTYAGPIAA